MNLDEKGRKTEGKKTKREKSQNVLRWFMMN